MESFLPSGTLSAENLGKVIETCANIFKGLICYAALLRIRNRRSQPKIQTDFSPRIVRD